MSRASLVLLAYNQENFIREAVEGAFSQVGVPLEIIISDDCSSDRTFAIMQEMAATYKGPHTVRLNRNEANLGLIAHYNKVCQSATGQMLIFAAGDDISAPCRVQRIMDEWAHLGQPQQAVFYSKVQRISQEGLPVPEEGAGFGCEQQNDPERLFSEWGGFVIGASMAATRGVFERFGGLLPNMPCEDIPMLWRGALCGHLHFVPEALVRWRVGGHGQWSCVYGRDPTAAQRLDRMKRFLRERRTLVQQARTDVAVAGENKGLLQALDRYEEETERALSSVEGSGWRFLIRYVRLWAKNGQVSQAVRACVVEHIRISKALGRNRCLWAMAETVAAAHHLISRNIPTRT